MSKQDEANHPVITQPEFLYRRRLKTFRRFRKFWRASMTDPDDLLRDLDSGEWCHVPNDARVITEKAAARIRADGERIVELEAERDKKRAEVISWKKTARALTKAADTMTAKRLAAEAKADKLQFEVNELRSIISECYGDEQGVALFELDGELKKRAALAETEPPKDGDYRLVKFTKSEPPPFVFDAPEPDAEAGRGEWVGDREYWEAPTAQAKPCECGGGQCLDDDGVCVACGRAPKPCETCGGTGRVEYLEGAMTAPCPKCSPGAEGE